MKIEKLIFFIWMSYLSHLALAEPPKRGTSVCTGSDCNSTGVFARDERQEAQPKFQSVDEIKGKGKTIDQAISSQKYRSHSLTKRKELEKNETNLPNYYQGYEKTSPKKEDSVVYVAVKKFEKLSQVHIGDIYRAVIEQELEVSSQVKQPVRAILISGTYRGSILVGEASLDLELKRVLLDFKHFRVAHPDQSFSVKAVGLSQNGTLGLKGEYHSELGKFFIAEALSSFAAAALDSTIQRNQNAFGGYMSEPSLGNSAKAGAVSAISKTTDRFAEKVRNAPESTTAPAWQEIQILIQEEPKEVN